EPAPLRRSPVAVRSDRGSSAGAPVRGSAGAGSAPGRLRSDDRRERADDVRARPRPADAADVAAITAELRTPRAPGAVRAAAAAPAPPPAADAARADASRRDAGAPAAPATDDAHPGGAASAVPRLADRVARDPADRAVARQPAPDDVRVGRGAPGCVR